MKISLFVLISFFVSLEAHADLTPNELASNIAARPANEGRVGKMHFLLRNASGNERKRSALVIHSDTHDVVKIGIYFTSPSAISNTSFLSFDYPQKEDQSWLFLPATERVRRLPSSDNSDNFMGTDMTYGDVKDDFKFSMSDWDFTEITTTQVEDKLSYTLNGAAKTPEIAKQLGYLSFTAVVDAQTLFPTSIEYKDIDGELLKTIKVLKQELVGDAWTATHFIVKNIQSEHSTEIHLENMRYIPNIPPDILQAQSLAYGLPDISN